MAYHHAKASYPVQEKLFLVLSRTWQAFSTITQHEQLIDKIFYGEKISFNIPMTRTTKVSF